MRAIGASWMPSVESGVLETLQAELVALHTGWMALAFPRQHPRPDFVLGRWRPSTAIGWFQYLAWGLVGLVVVGLLYPIGLLGTPIRAVVRRLGRLADAWGLAGVVWSLAVLAGVAAAVVWFWVCRPVATVIAVAVGIAVLAAALAVTAVQVRGRPTTVAVAYPLGLVAVGLIPAAVVTVRTGRPERLIQHELATALGALEATPVVGPALSFEPSVVGNRPAVLAALTANGIVLGWVAGVLVVLTDLARPADR